MKTVNPSKNFVFAEKMEAEGDRVTKSGLLLAAPKIVNENLARVVEVGPSSDIIFEKGRVIFYKPYTANEIRLDDKDYVVVNVNDILGVLND